MWRPILYCMLLVLPALCLQAQAQEEPPPRISPLFNYLTSNSSLHRSPTFRNMQEDINTRLKNVKPGLRVDYFFDKMSAVHKALGQRLQAEFDSKNSFIRIYLIDNAQKDSNRIALDTLRLKDQTLSLFYSQAVEKWREKLTEELKKAFLVIKDESTQKAIVEQIGNIVLTTGVEANKLRSSDATSLPDSIIKTYFGGVINLLKYDLEQRAGFSWDKPISIDNAILTVALLNNFFDQVHSTIIRVLERTEHTLTTGIQEISTWLISGNTGIAVERGAGDFSGGVHFALNIDTNFQIGTYLNSNFTADSSQPGRWLIGAQMRYTAEYGQVDFLLGGLVGNNNRFKDGDCFEGGISIQGRGGNFIIGEAVFIRWDLPRGATVSSLTSSWGIFYKAASSHAPTFLAGIISSEGYQSPFFKIIYPITGQQ